MVVERSVAEAMSTPVIVVRKDTPLQEAVQLMSEHHISGLPVVDENGVLVGELTEQDLMVRESGFDAGPYVMFLDAVIYLRNPLEWDKQVHQVLGSTVAEVMRARPHTCSGTTTLPAAAKQLHESSIQRLFVLDEAHHPIGVLTRGDVVRALAAAG
jgi:CBS domain-containing protein